MASGSQSNPQALGADYKIDVMSTPLTPTFIEVKEKMDVIQALHDYALRINKGLIILSGLGAVRKIYFPKNTKTYHDEGIYQIMSLSGSMIPAPIGKYFGDINLVLSDVNGATLGGVVQNLQAETKVQVVVCAFPYVEFHNQIRNLMVFGGQGRGIL